MQLIGFFKAVLLGIVEGLTEFLPVSSTGHLIIVDQFLNFQKEFGSKSELFDIFIQFGAILSVILYFRKKLIPFGGGKTPKENRRILHIWTKIIVGCFPGLVFGAIYALLDLKKYLMTPAVVAVALLVGGIILIWLESRKKEARFGSIFAMTYQTAFLIGMFQCLAMIPGTSRSAATIIGAMLLGASRGAAAEFSFYLAVPTLFAASAYSLLDLFKDGGVTGTMAFLLAVGFVVSFVVAYVVIAAFMKFIRAHDFKPFGWYRIALGVLILALLAAGFFHAAVA